MTDNSDRRQTEKVDAAQARAAESRREEFTVQRVRWVDGEKRSQNVGDSGRVAESKPPPKDPPSTSGGGKKAEQK